MTLLNQLVKLADLLILSTRKHLESKHRFEYGDITIDEIDELERELEKRKRDWGLLKDEVKRLNQSPDTPSPKPKADSSPDCTDARSVGESSGLARR